MAYFINHPSLPLRHRRPELLSRSDIYGLEDCLPDELVSTGWEEVLGGNKPPAQGPGPGGLPQQQQQMNGDDNGGNVVVVPPNVTMQQQQQQQRSMQQQQQMVAHHLLQQVSFVLICFDFIFLECHDDWAGKY